MKVLITGGAGYIGSVIAVACEEAGITPVVLDNLTAGRANFGQGRIFYIGNILDGAVLDKIFSEHQIDACIHCAALTEVPQSVVKPVSFYDVNVTGTLTLAKMLIRNNCQKLVFSSTCAFYDSSAGGASDENTPIAPQSPYARTKAACDWMLADIANAHALKTVSFRYFNPIGAHPGMLAGAPARSPASVLSKLIRSAETGVPFRITGTDYPTRDGTGIRDYVHVWDLARAHVSALTAFPGILGGNSFTAINLGSGTGTTVRELVNAFNEVSEKKVTTVDAPRRPGDIAVSTAAAYKALRLISWRPLLSIHEGIRDALAWQEVLASEYTGQV